MRNLGTGAQIKLAAVKAEKKGNHYLVSINALVLCLGVSGQMPDLNVGEHIFPFALGSNMAQCSNAWFIILSDSSETKLLGCIT